MTLYEIEELIKAKKSNAIKAMLRNAAIISDPASTQEMRDQARDNILAIDHNKSHPKNNKIESGTEKMNNLESAMAAAKPALSGKINEKISNAIKTQTANYTKVKEEAAEAAAEKRAKVRAYERINGRGPWHSHKIDPLEWEEFHPNVKKHFADREDPEKKAKREDWNYDNQVLTGSDHTRRELTSAVARAGGVEKPKEIKVRETTPEQKAAAAKSKVKSTIDSALGLVHDAHANGLHDKAVEILNAIPKEHMPSNMKGYNPAYIYHNVTPNHWAAMAPEHRETLQQTHMDIMKRYNPAYIHYDVTPNHWAALAPEHRETLQQTHMDVMNGKHDNNPDPDVQKIISKVKPPSS